MFTLLSLNGEKISSSIGTRKKVNHLFARYALEKCIWQTAQRVIEGVYYDVAFRPMINARSHDQIV